MERVRASFGVVCVDCVGGVDSHAIHHGSLVLLSGLFHDYSTGECWECGTVAGGYRYGVNVYSKGVS